MSIHWALISVPYPVIDQAIVASMIAWWGLFAVIAAIFFLVFDLDEMSKAWVIHHESNLHHDAKTRSTIKFRPRYRNRFRGYLVFIALSPLLMPAVFIVIFFDRFVSSRIKKLETVVWVEALDEYHVRNSGNGGIAK